MRRFRPAAALLALLLAAPPLLLPPQQARAHAAATTKTTATTTTNAPAFAPYDGVLQRAARRRKKSARRSRRASQTGAASAAGNGAARFTVEEIKEPRLAELMRRGGAASRPLLVNFWATWCEPCRKEFPDLVLVDQEFRPRGLDFITVSIDDVSELETGVPQFLREMRATRIPAYLLNADDPETAIRSVDDRWRGELPATFLYDRAGKLAYRHVGRVNLEELRTAIKKVMND